MTKMIIITLFFFLQSEPQFQALVSFFSSSNNWLPPQSTEEMFK